MEYKPGDRVCFRWNRDRCLIVEEQREDGRYRLVYNNGTPLGLAAPEHLLLLHPSDSINKFCKLIDEYYNI